MRPTASFTRRFQSGLRGEIKVFDQYLQGDVWRHVIKDNAGKLFDSRGGFYCREHAKRPDHEALARAEQRIDLSVRP